MIDEQIKRQTVELRLEGMPSLDVAERLGINVLTVRKQWRIWAEKLGMDVPEKRCYQKSDWISDDQKRKIVEMKLSGMTNSEIYIETGVSTSMIGSNWRIWAEEAGIAVPDKQPPRAKARKKAAKDGEITDELKAKAAWMKFQNIPTKDIADRLGIPAKTIGLYWRQWARECGIELAEPVPEETPSAHGDVISRQATPEEIMEIERKIPPDPEDLITAPSMMDRPEGVCTAAQNNSIKTGNEESIMSKEKTPAEEAVSLMGRIDELLTAYLTSGKTVTRFVLDVDDDNSCALSVVDDPECGKRMLQLEVQTSIPLEDEERRSQNV